MFRFKFIISLLIGCLLSPTLMADIEIRVTKLPVQNGIQQGHAEKGLELHGVLLLESLEKQSDVFNELSGLAWDEDEQILYAISDGAHLFHLTPLFKDNELVDVAIKKHYPLKDETGTPLKGKLSDSEGLAIVNHQNNQADDTALLISFEREPRVIRYSTEGDLIETLRIPNRLKDVSNYRKKNKQLEALTWHQDFGFIIGPERPLADQTNTIGLYSSQGRVAEMTISHEKKGSLVGLETLPSGNLLALERVFINVLAGLQFSLHHLVLEDEHFVHQKEKTITITAADGLFNDNFEAIAHHKEDYFFMVSDDNKRSIQRSLLIYVRLPGLMQTDAE